MKKLISTWHFLTSLTIKGHFLYLRTGLKVRSDIITLTSFIIYRHWAKISICMSSHIVTVQNYLRIKRGWIDGLKYQWLLDKKNYLSIHCVEAVASVDWTRVIRCLASEQTRSLQVTQIIKN